MSRQGHARRLPPASTEEAFRRLFEPSEDGVLHTDPGGTILDANPAACRLIGRSREALRGRARAELFASSDPRARDFLAELESTRSAASDLTLLRADGRAVEVHARSSVYVDEEARPWPLLVFTEHGVRDEQQRRFDAAFRILLESEERFRLTVNQAPIGIGLVGLDGRFLELNHRWCEIVGYPPEELVRLRFQDITHPDDLEADLALVQALVRGEIPRYELAKRYIRRDGEVVDVLLHVSLVRGPNGEPRHFISQIQDVTERNRLEAQLAVADRMASVGTLASGIAHEINNPLTYVRANLELAAERVRLLEDVAPETARDLRTLLAEAHEGADRVRKIVRELRTFARPDLVERQPVDLHAALEVAIRMSGNEIRHRARLRREYGPVPPLHSDESRLVQVFVNLLVNAAHAIPEGHADDNEIGVHTRTDPDGRVVVEIRDSGGGIPPALLGRIFDPFFTTKEVGTGTGLGLAVSHALVTALGGRIEVESAVGDGALFRVSFPAPREADGKSDPLPEETDPPRIHRRGRVLVVDDDENVANAVARMLEREHEVEIVHSGEEAVARAREGGGYDAILCDVMMPDMSGADVHAALMLTAPEQARRIVFISGGAFTPAAQDFLERARNPCLEKPFDTKRVRATVRALVDGEAGRA